MALLCAGWWSVVPATAQSPAPSHEDPYGPEATPSWVGHFTVFSANALLSGLTAGSLRRLRGGSFSEGFTRGVLGGGAVYAGKRIAVQRWEGAGLLGREVAAVGASVVRNAGEGRGALELLTLPVGPVRLHVRTGAEPGIRATVDLHNLFWTGYGLVDPALRFDAGASLSAGAPVFRTRDQLIIWRHGRETVHGLAPAGTIFLADLPTQDAPDRSRLFAHERVHVIQNDQVFHTLGDPLETWLLGHLPGGRSVARVVDLNVLLWAAAYSGGRAMIYEQRPWELEADFLAER